MTIEEYDRFVRSNLTLFHKHILRLQLAHEIGQFESLSIPAWGEQFSLFLEEAFFEGLDKDNEGC